MPSKTPAWFEPYVCNFRINPSIKVVTFNVSFTECLEELGTLIQYNGMSVCGTQPQKTVPVIAHQITDRDNTVRSAALNAMVIVYGNTGEGVYKFTAQVRVPFVCQYIHYQAHAGSLRSQSLEIQVHIN